MCDFTPSTVGWGTAHRSVGCACRVCFSTPRFRKAPMKSMIFCLICTLATPLSWALPPAEAQKLYDELSPSLVAVQYTVDGEFGRRELIGQAVIVGEEGTVIASLALFPTQ